MQRKAAFGDKPVRAPYARNTMQRMDDSHDSLARRFGKPGLPPAIVRAFFGQLADGALEFVPEADRAEAAAEMAKAFDHLETSIKPMEDGEMLLAPDVALRYLQEMVGEAVERLRREWQDS